MSRARTLLLLLLTAAVALAQPAPTRPAAALHEVDLRLPAAVAAPRGLALRVCWPAAASAAAAPAAPALPVVVVVGGGWAGGSVSRTLVPAAAAGCIEVRFCWPGEGDGQFASDGEPDLRGPNATAALADVIAFAAGRAPGADGRRLADLVAPAEPGALGLVALAEGGNTALVTLAQHPAALAAVDWLATWETPLGDGLALGLAGDAEYGRSPAWDALVGRWRAELLAWDARGFFYCDVDRDGTLSAGDWPLAALSLLQDDGSRRAAYPRAVLAAAPRVLPVPPPELLSGTELEAFWTERVADATTLQTIATARPELRVMVLGARPDHAIPAVDHPHLWALYEGWRAAGLASVKLNPSPTDLQAAGVELPADYADTPAGTPLTRPDLAARLPASTHLSAARLLWAAVLGLSR